RCKGGIVFSELNAPVKTAFALLGSPDERNFHLKALVAIAHIVQEPDFERRWLEARNIDQLRDVILLSRRRRIPGAFTSVEYTKGPIDKAGETAPSAGEAKDDSKELTEDTGEKHLHSEEHTADEEKAPRDNDD
ncbi:MAG: PTS sugar transporter subunit IIA, partial [Planctomycetes bacterium]|nr:PTS sugar transporter subunit IIA [Planctomycetota bacterium]